MRGNIFDVLNKTRDQIKKPDISIFQGLSVVLAVSSAIQTAVTWLSTFDKTPTETKDAAKQSIIGELTNQLNEINLRLVSNKTDAAAKEALNDAVKSVLTFLATQERRLPMNVINPLLACKKYLETSHPPAEQTAMSSLTPRR